MPQKNRRPHSIWLCPGPPESDDLIAVIEQIIRTTDSPKFATHVTLLGDLIGDPGRTMAVCKELFASLGDIRVMATGLSQADEFFMSLFLDLELTPELSDLRRKLSDTLEVPQTSFRPHLSLANGALPDPFQPAFVDALSTQFEGFEFRLSHICVVASAQEIPIHEWRVLECAPLVSGTPMVS